MIRTRKNRLHLTLLSALALPLFLASGSFSHPEAAPSRDIPPLVLPRVVMFGDSITFGGKWNELLNSESIFNLGLKSDNTEGFLSRLPDVFEHKPNLCFIMGGVNDIAQGVPVEQIFENYQKIVKELRARGITPIIQATLYTRRNKLNPKIHRLNEKLLRFAQDSQLEFLDLNQRLASDKRLLRQYTFDGIHLLPAAYQHWGALVMSTIDRHASNLAPQHPLQARSSRTQN